MDFLMFVRKQWDRVAAWAAFGAGGIFLLLGWFGVSDNVLPAGQLPYIISGGIGGACLIGIGAVLWLSADLRDEWGELHEIARHLEAAAEPRPPTPPAMPSSSPQKTRSVGDKASVKRPVRRPRGQPSAT